MKRIRVLESFPEPRPTTNPYLVQLVRSLDSSERLIVRRFSWKEALTGDYDVLHLHWPDALLAGRNRLSRFLKLLAVVVLMIRLSIRRTPIVRTVHNARPHESTLRARWVERLAGRRTRVRIHLNDTEARLAGDIVIPHGDYRAWYSQLPRESVRDDTISYVGLIRPYKGVEDLIAAFRSLGESGTEMMLEIAGAPRTTALAEALTELIGDAPNIRTTFAFLPDDAFVRQVTSSRLVVLPYREMSNSGVALAVLSLDRPILVPRSAHTLALQREVGARWVALFDAPLTAPQLGAALESVHPPVVGEVVAFTSRDWGEVAQRHVDAFETALRRH